MSGQRASQMQLLNTVIGLNAAQREPLSVVSELQGHGLVIGLFHISVWVVSPKCLKSRLTDATPIAFELKRERHRGFRCSRLVSQAYLKEMKSKSCRQREQPTGKIPRLEGKSQTPIRHPQ